MFTCVQHSVDYLVSREIGVLEFYLFQGVKYRLQTFAIIKCRETFDILKNEVFRPSPVNVVSYMPEDFSSTFFVIKALLFACLTEGLAWKTSAIEIYAASAGMIAGLDIFVHNLRRPVLLDRFTNHWLNITAELVNEKYTLFLKCLHWSLDARTISAYRYGVSQTRYGACDIHIFNR